MSFLIFPPTSSRLPNFPSLISVPLSCSSLSPLSVFPLQIMAETRLRRMALLLEEQQQCPCCFDPIVPPFACCENGHLICPVCRLEMTACPNCRGAIEPRMDAFLLDRLYTLLHPDRPPVAPPPPREDPAVVAARRATIREAIEIRALEALLDDRLHKNIPDSHESPPPHEQGNPEAWVPNPPRRNRRGGPTPRQMREVECRRHEMRFYYPAHLRPSIRPHPRGQGFILDLQ